MGCLVLLAGVLSVATGPVMTAMLYDLAGLKPEIREGMKRETTRIFRSAGVELEWVDCEVDGTVMNPADCGVPIGAGQVMLQIAPGVDKTNPRAAGRAITGESCVFACLYAERVKELAREGKWEVYDLLGHAAAHELGHLLLCSSAHTHAGVMRATWEAEDLRGLSHAGLVFLRGQLSHLRFGAHVRAPTEGAGGR